MVGRGIRGIQGRVFRAIVDGQESRDGQDIVASPGILELADGVVIQVLRAGRDILEFQAIQEVV